MTVERKAFGFRSQIWSWDNNADNFISEDVYLGEIDEHGARIIALMLNEDDEFGWTVYETVTEHSTIETVVNFCTQVERVVVLDSDDLTPWEETLIEAMRQERALYADCFGKDWKVVQ